MNSNENNNSSKNSKKSKNNDKDNKKSMRLTRNPLSCYALVLPVVLDSYDIEHK